MGFFFLAIGAAPVLKLPLVEQIALEHRPVPGDKAAPRVLGYLLGGAVRAAGCGQRAFPVGIAPNRASGPERVGHYRRGAGGGAGAQRLAGAGHLGLHWAVGEPLGEDMPAVHGLVVPAGRAGDRGLRLAGLLAVWRGEAEVQAGLSRQKAAR